MAYRRRLGCGIVPDACHPLMYVTCLLHGNRVWDPLTVVSCWCTEQYHMRQLSMHLYCKHGRHGPESTWVGRTQRQRRLLIRTMSSSFKPSGPMGRFCGIPPKCAIHLRLDARNMAVRSHLIDRQQRTLDQLFCSGEVATLSPQKFGAE